MGCLCCKEENENEETRRHPLLRSEHPSSSSADKSSINSIEIRAHFDAIRGPPVVVTMREDNTKSPSILRSSLNGPLKMDYFRLTDDRIPMYVWCRIHLKDIIEHIRVFNTLTRPHCNRKACKTMSGSPNVDYKWTYGKDGFFSEENEKKISAASYIEKAIDNCSKLLKANFSKSVEEEKTYAAAKTIASLVFRVYCHILYHHHDLFVESHTIPHLNSCFIWFVLFANESSLLDEDECEPLQVLITDIVKAANEADAQGGGDNVEPGLQLSLTTEDRMSSFLQSFASDDVSKLTASSYGTATSTWAS